MIQFPETAAAEWEVAANTVQAAHDLRKRIQHATKVDAETDRLRIRHDAALAFEQEISGAETVLEMTTLANYKSNPAAAPVDMIDGVLKAQSTCIVIGPSGSGKSTLALQMLNSLMSGDDFLAQPTKPIMGSVGVMSYDMDASMVLDWMSGFPGVDAGKISVVNAHRRGNPLAVPPMRAQIVAGWNAMNVEVVVVDSFSASFFGHDQNDAASTMAHYRELQKFALGEVGAKVLIVIAHSTVDSPHKIRGSTVHHDVADTIVAVEGTGLETRKVSMVKYRAALGQTMMTPVMVSEPDSVTHLVSIDTGAMTLEGLALPPAMAADIAFPDINEDPDTSIDEEVDDL